MNRNTENKFIWDRSFRKRLTCFVACVVVFVTTYALVLPALTLEHPTAEQDAGQIDEIRAEEPLEAAEDVPTAEPETPPPAEVETGHTEESAAQWDEMFRALERSGDYREDLLAVACSQLGYREAPDGYTRYGQFCGYPQEEWCAMFIAFCLHYAGVPDDALPLAYACPRWLALLRGAERFDGPDGTPEPGDIVFFDYNFDGESDHVGIVESVENPALHVIEGSCEDQVMRTAYDRDDPAILGYGRLPDSMPAQSFSDRAGSLLVSVRAEEGALPTGCTMRVQPVTDPAVLGDARAAAKAPVSGIQAVDISFYDRRGAEIEPRKSVQVVLTAAALLNSPDDPVVVHVDDAGNAALVPETSASGSSVSFASSEFSIYCVVYTVDFTYGGGTFRIPGEGTVTLSSLFAELGIQTAVSEVLSVRFSDPALVRVEQAGDDWTLVSLRPFSTVETLSVTLNSGAVLAVSVTDAQHITDLSRLLDTAKLFENGVLLPWPATVRENKTYELRLTFKENQNYQFIDNGEWMVYDLPDGVILGLHDFERTFTMDVGDGVMLEGNKLFYDAELRRLSVQWNTEDLTGFNKLKASNSAEFMVDLNVQFSFDPDEIEFNENVVGKVILDTSFDVDVAKTGEYDRENDRIDYTVTVTSYGNAENVKVYDDIAGTALRYISDPGVRWSSSAGENSTVRPASPAPANGFSLVVGQMRDGETLTFTYSAEVDYEALTGAGTLSDTRNTVTVDAGTPKTASYNFEDELRYVSLEKSHRRISWSSDPAEPATVYWTLRVNEAPKVGLANTDITDRIYAGDVEGMDYAGDGIHVRVTDRDGGFVGEYDVPWSELRRTALAYDAGTDEYEYAGWTYTIPATQQADRDGQTVTIDNSEKLVYDITYTTLADRTKIIFDGYIGNEAQEHRTGTLRQDGFYPPGVGTMPEVHKQVVASDEQYIYWDITFDRQGYDLTRCVVEDNNPSLWGGYKEPVDVSTNALTGEYEYLSVDGLTAEETWEVSSASDTSTSFRFYRDQAKRYPGLLKAAPGRDQTITIHLRTVNHPGWIEGTTTKYWPREHVNTVTWFPNGHRVQAEAQAIPDIRKILKEGEQAGTITDPATGVALPVFRFTLYLLGVSAEDFDGRDLVIRDTFNTQYLEYLDVSGLTSAQVEALGASVNWDGRLKGFGRNNEWVGPVNVIRADTPEGVSFTVTDAAMKTRKPNGRLAGMEPEDENAYCLRYALPYYLVVKDAEAASALAALANGDGELPDGVERVNNSIRFTNTAAWDGAGLQSEAAAEADFRPASKTMTYDPNNDLAAYEVVLNPQRLRLNDGKMIRVEDAYENLAVDFSTVTITTQPPDRAAQVEWAYHNNKGTFWIPDETLVTIRYDAQPIGDRGKDVTFSNAVTMLDYEVTVTDTEHLSHEAEGFAGDYNIRLFKYQDNAMNLPLEGAIFQLYEDGDGSPGDVLFEGRWYRPMHYLADWSSETDEDRDINTARHYTYEGGDYPTGLNHAAGDPVFFTTHRDGYADIRLHQQRDGLALERGKQYYLHEAVTPAGFQKEDIFWSFIIDDMDYFDPVNRIFVYRDGGVLTASNTSADSGLVLRKDFTGDPLTWEQQRGVTFDIVIRDGDGAVYSREITYEDFVRDYGTGGYRFKIRPEDLNLEPDTVYTCTVTEKNAALETHEHSTSIYTWSGVVSEEAPNDFSGRTEEVHGTSSETPSVSFAVTKADFDSSRTFRVWFENDYTAKPVDLTVRKLWGEKAQPLTGKAVDFVLYRNGVPYERFTLSDAEGWSRVFEDLDRIDGTDKTQIDWSVGETAVRYVDGDGHSISVEGEDIDLQFVIDAADAGGPVSVRGGEAHVDLTGREDGALTFTNELAELTPVVVRKVWYGEDGEVDETHGEDDTVVFDLYRTTGELPKGGQERQTFEVLPHSNNNAGIQTPSIEARDGDLIDITLTSRQPVSVSWNQNVVCIINFGGLIETTRYIGTPFIYEGVEYSQRWAYAFDVVGVFDTAGNDVSSDYSIRNHYGDNGPDLAATWVSYHSTRETIVIRVKVDHLDWMTTGENRGKFFIRTSSPCDVSLSNYSQDSENIRREKLLEHIGENGLTPFRTGLELKPSELWQYVNQLPQADAAGNPYTYFAVERQMAGYEDTYYIEPDGAVTISNRPMENPIGGSLTVTKHAAGLPSEVLSGENPKTFRFRVKNGSKYLVQKPDGSYALMSVGQAGTAGYVSVFTLTHGESMTFAGLLPGTYTVEEDTAAAQVSGYTLLSAATMNGHIDIPAGGGAQCTLTNTYTPIPTAFTFGKLWTGSDDRVPAAWPDGETVTLTVRRRSGGVTDENFRLVYTIDRDGNAVLDEAQSRRDETDDLEFTTLEPGAYHHYRYTVSGVAKRSLQGQDWEYYVTEAPKSGCAISYGGVNGTTAAPVEGKTDAVGKPDPGIQETEYVINQYQNREITFSKRWIHPESGAVWPTMEREIPPDETGGESVVETVKVPITVRIQRRLRYPDPSDAYAALLSPNYDPGFSLSFENLTDGSTSRAQNTDEGRIILTMTEENGGYRYAVSGLREKGGMAVGGVQREGDWVYYITETPVEGYATDYLDGAGLPSPSASTVDTGVIRNSLIRGRLIVEKQAEGLPDPQRSFRFAVRGSGGYLCADGALTAGDPGYSLLAGGRMIFYDVPAGEYAVEELPDAGIPGYSLTVRYDPADTVSVENNAQTNVTIRNRYDLQTTDFPFAKIWLPADETDDTPQSWPENQTITVALTRSAAGAQDADFLPVWQITYRDGHAVYTLDQEASRLPDSVEPRLSATGSEGSVYGFLISDLPQYDSAGVPWTYAVAETPPHGFGATYADSAGQPVSGSAGSGGTIYNRKNLVDVRVTKQWFGWEPEVPVAWPEGETIDLTLTGTKEGDTVVRSFTLGPVPPGDGAPYRLEVAGTDYVFTFTDLPAGYSYTVSEGSVAGYHTQYVRQDGAVQRSQNAWTDDGGVIRNILTTFELPQSGGGGPVRFYLAGGFLLCLFAALLLRRRRTAR